MTPSMVALIAKQDQHLALAKQHYLEMTAEQQDQAVARLMDMVDQDDSVSPLLAVLGLSMICHSRQKEIESKNDG